MLRVLENILYFLKSITLFVISISLLFGCSKDDKDDFIFNPKDQIDRFYTSDIDLFWQAYDYISPQFTKDNFQNIYINNGSIGLKDYAMQKQLANGLEKIFSSPLYHNYYSAIRINTQDLTPVINKSKIAFEQFQKINPAIEIFDVYFLIGAMGAVGRVSENGLLIAVEMFSTTNEFNIGSLSEWHQDVIKTKDYLPLIIVHELVHKQQRIIPKNSEYKTLLEQSILEGMADYIACHLLPVDPFFNQHLHTFGDTIEEKLWDEFKIEKDKNYEDTEWLYTGNNMTNDYPADMGYYIGFKIIEAYSNKFENKTEAINNMLKNSNYYDILAQSNYEDKFE